MNNHGNEHEMKTANNYVNNEQLQRRNWKPVEDVPCVIFAKVGAAIMLDRKRLVRTPFLIDNNLMAYLFDGSWDVDFGKTLFDTIFLPRYAQAGALPSYNGPDIEGIDVHIPIKEEQAAIAKIFISLGNLITLHQRKLDKLQELKEAFLDTVFNQQLRFEGYYDAWEPFKLGEVASVSMNRRIFREQTTESGDVPFFKIGTFGSVPDAYISRELFEEYRAKYPYPKIGDILISASGSIGKTVEYTGEDEYFQDSNIVWLNHGGKINNKFLKSFYNVVKWAGIEGSTIKRLYNETILNTRIYLPTLDEQRRVGSLFTSFDNHITLHQNKLDKLHELKKAFLDSMFV